MSNIIIAFNATISNVEERFEKVIKDAKAYGEAKSETQADEATEIVSRGWWLSLDGWGLAISTGTTKPDFEIGDTVTVSISK